MAERILFLDGAMGTTIQSYGLSEEDYKGETFKNHPVLLKGNNDILNLTKPELVKEIHKRFLDAGADIIETNTFNGTSYSQSEYQLSDLAYEINKQAALLAKEAVTDKMQMDGSARFVAGVLGPTGKTLSLSPRVEEPAYRDLTMDDLVDSYFEAAKGLYDGGADILLIETVFDTLNAKAAILAVQRLFTELQKTLPVMISGTITDASGRTLSGQTAESFWYSVAHADPISIGFNCALGAKEMHAHISTISRIADTAVSTHPNAGLPDEMGDYKETPELMAEILAGFAEEGLLNIVGGCCGTRPEHIQAIKKRLENYPPRTVPEKRHKTVFTGLEPLIITPETNFVPIGERTNVAGSRKFARLIRDKQYEEALDIARLQVENGAAIIDINLDDALLDTEKEMEHFLKLVASEPEICKVPIMVDSSKWSVLQIGLKQLQGKGLVNSISLKEGEQDFLHKAEVIRSYGAAAVVIAFDEKGQADSLERKLDIGRRSCRLLIDELDFPPENIILDLNVFAVATGMAEHKNYAKDFIDAVKILHDEFPLIHFSGGISNLSFSFRGNNVIREAMHSIFLYHAIKVGLDMGIVNAGQLTVYDEIPEELKTVAEAVILNTDSDAEEKLIELAEKYSGRGAVQQNTLEWREKGTLEEKLQYALLKGITQFIDEDLSGLLAQGASPLSLIEGPLMNGMNRVGALFGDGKMFLPQVVKSARVMKKAVGFLEPYMEDSGEELQPPAADIILLATVKGDVHDIGKNIVGVVLQCNSYDVVDMGVMVPTEDIINKAKEIKPRCIGLSGLITPSLDEMVFIAEEMQRQGFNIPLLIGGATTSSVHTALKIAPAYQGPVVHVPDASLAPGVLQQLLGKNTSQEFIDKLKMDQQNIRESREKAKEKIKLLPFSAAMKKKPVFEWEQYNPQLPANPGRHVFKGLQPEVLLPRFEWPFFFLSCGLKGKYPAILDDPEKGEQARQLQQDALEFLKENASFFEINAVSGLFPADSGCNTVQYYNEGKTKEIAQFHTVRQQETDPRGDVCYSLSDFVSPAEANKLDYAGLFACCVKYSGPTDDPYFAMLSEALSFRLVEAAAEWLQEHTEKTLWGIGDRSELSMIRPGPGYPSCADHSDKGIIHRILQAEEIGIKLTESYMMDPTASVAGFYFVHPEAKYFNLRGITTQQLKHYASAKDRTLDETRKWLALEIFEESTEV